MPDATTLNENQQKAVQWNDGPLLVLAGPGSGKTRVLTLRIARILQETPQERFRILGITFTNKAAAEMRTRLDDLVRDGRERAILTTFHSFAAEVLRQHGSHVGLRPDFTILTQVADRQAVLVQAVREVGGEEGSDAPNAEGLLPLIDRLLDECVQRGCAEGILGKTPKGSFLALVYDKYLDLLLTGNQLDFGALIVTAVGLLEGQPHVASQLRKVYRYVCVDEFQDTNASQGRFLLQLITPQAPNLFVVADDDQVIYQWNGANPKRLSEIRERYSMETIQLPENFRCPREVIEIANRLIKHNEDRAPDKEDLRAVRTERIENVLRVIESDDLDDEIAWIRNDILGRPDSERPRCVVLGRTRRLLETVVADFASNGLKAHIPIRKTEFESAPLRWLHALLRLANARGNREQVRRLCKAFFELEGVDVRVEDVVAQAPLHSGDYLRTWLVLTEGRDLADATRKVLAAARTSLLERNDFEQIVGRAFVWFAILQTNAAAVGAEAFDDFEAERTTWESIQREIIAETGKDNVTLHSLLQGFDLRSKEPPEPKDAIRCYTIHAAKGLEFRHVYLMGLVEDQLPSWAAIKKGDQSLEMREERRNCFVAITRTQQTLTLTYAGSYFGYDKRPSRFLSEMGLLH